MFTLPSWALPPGNTDDGRIGHKAHDICHPRCCTSLWEVYRKVETDMVLSLTRSNVFADQSRSHARVVTAQVWALKSRESLTKRLFEHWLNISRSYKKQHGIGGYSRQEREPKSNPVHSRNLLFSFLVDFSPLCPCRLTGLVWATKTSVTQMQCMIPTKNI